MSDNFDKFPLTSDEYVAFDATSMRDLLVNRLIEKGVFTDQIFAGSNISSIIDIMAYSYHVLMFYLNKTSSETMFTDTDLYENISRVVKLLNYNPIGARTSTLTIRASVDENLPVGSYTIPRYSSVNTNGIIYSFTKDITFTKATTELEEIKSIGDNNLLYQGVYRQYPLQRSTGEDFETVILSISDEKKSIDHSSIDVYCKTVGLDGTVKWHEYKQIDSLFLASPTDLVYEKRLNESGRYEIKFGDGVTGKKLNTDDEIVIYYLLSDMEAGVVGANMINSFPLTINVSESLDNILADVKFPGTSYIDINQSTNFKLINNLSSTKPELSESVDDIRKNAPEFFKSQNRLVTANDFEVYVSRNYGNILQDVKVVNNDDYLNGHLSYIFEDLGLDKPQSESRVLYNHVTFATSANFNNVYIYALPKTQSISSEMATSSFLSPTQKGIITNSLDRLKMLTIQPVVVDPVHVCIDIGAAYPGESRINLDIKDSTRIVVVKDLNNQSDNDNIKKQIVDVIVSTFGSSSSLGQMIDINKMYFDMINISGVRDIYMTRTDTGQSTVKLKQPGLSLMVWNPIYPDQDIQVISQNLQLPYFKASHIYDETCLYDKIIIQ